MPSNWVKDYFTFNKHERIAIVVLVLMILSVYFLPSFFSGNNSHFDAKEHARFDSLAQLFNETDSEEVKQHSSSYHSKSEVPNAELFPFDPNNTSQNDWQRLGINAKTIQTILHYVEKGGRFQNADDLKKIYGLRSEDYNRIQPYIRIERNEIVLPSKNDSFKRKSPDTFYHESRSRKEFFYVDINVIDSQSLCKLPGIGSKLASRIIHFRERLGGFYSIEQVAETYGLPDSTFRKIQPFLNLGTEPLHTININEADVDMLKQHPYISWSMARALVQYREQHGSFKSPEDLSKISLFGGDQLKRLIPYLSTY